MILSHSALTEFPYECLQKAGQWAEQTALLDKLTLANVAFILNFFFQLLHLPNFIVLLLPSKLLVKNYESIFLSTVSTVSSQGDILQKQNYCTL